jgi:hypothetical protein
MTGETVNVSGTPLPPALTRTAAAEPPAAVGAALVPPFIAGPVALRTAPGPVVEASTPAASEVASTSEAASMSPAPSTSPTADEPMPWEVPEEVAADTPEMVSWPHHAVQGAALPAWDDGTADGEAEEVAPSRGDQQLTAFPLDAFFVPLDSSSVPNGYGEAEHRALAGRVADRLEELARALRQRGMPVLGAGGTSDELARLIAAVVAGFLLQRSE